MLDDDLAKLDMTARRLTRAGIRMAGSGSDEHARRFWARRCEILHKVFNRRLLWIQDARREKRRKRNARRAA